MLGWVMVSLGGTQEGGGSAHAAQLRLAAQLGCCAKQKLLGMQHLQHPVMLSSPPVTQVAGRRCGRQCSSQGVPSSHMQGLSSFVTCSASFMATGNHNHAPPAHLTSCGSVVDQRQDQGPWLYCNLVSAVRCSSNGLHRKKWCTDHQPLPMWDLTQTQTHTRHRGESRPPEMRW